MAEVLHQAAALLEEQQARPGSGWRPEATLGLQSQSPGVSTCPHSVHTPGPDPGIRRRPAPHQQEAPGERQGLMGTSRVANTICSSSH